MQWHIKKFKDLTTDELYKILKLRSEVFVVEQNCIYNDIDDKDYNSYHLFLTDDNKVVAGVRVLNKGVSYDEISIGRVVVHPEYRKKGIAKDMMLKAIDFIKDELNENKVRISAQLYLLEFYKSVGFEVIGEEYLEDNIPHIEMLYTK